MKRLVILLVVFLFGVSIRTQTSGEPAGAEEQPGGGVERWSAADLDIMLGPIALYPDPLIAVLLPAATQPAEIVMAVRYLNGGGDPNQIEAQPWDENVKALAHYPEVIRWMDENLEWTTQVGEAFLVQPEDVMDAIQRLRGYARTLGNLYSTPQQIVEVDEGDIDILPSDPEVFYLPVYQPDVVFTRPAVIGGGGYVSFGSRLPVGGWLKHDWDWRNRRLVMWNKENCRPRTWWSQSRATRFKSAGDFREWCPRPRGGKFPCKFWATRGQQSGRNSTSASPASVSRGSQQGAVITRTHVTRSSAAQGASKPQSAGKR